MSEDNFGRTVDSALSADTDTTIDENLVRTSDDGVVVGGEAVTIAVGQAGTGDSRPLSDQTQIIDDVAPGDNFILPAGISQDQIQYVQDGASLILILPSGAEITLLDFFLFEDLPPALTLADGTVMGPELIAAVIPNFDLNAIAAAAGGGTGGTGGNASYTPYASGDIGPGDDQLDLLPPVPGFPFELGVDDEVFPNVEDLISIGSPVAGFSKGIPVFVTVSCFTQHDGATQPVDIPGPDTHNHVVDQIIDIDMSQHLIIGG